VPKRHAAKEDRGQILVAMALINMAAILRATAPSNSRTWRRPRDTEIGLPRHAAVNLTQSDFVEAIGTTTKSEVKSQTRNS